MVGLNYLEDFPYVTSFYSNFNDPHEYFTATERLKVMRLPLIISKQITIPTLDDHSEHFDLV